MRSLCPLPKLATHRNDLRVALVPRHCHSATATAPASVITQASKRCCLNTLGHLWLLAPASVACFTAHYTLGTDPVDLNPLALCLFATCYFSTGLPQPPSVTPLLLHMATMEGFKAHLATPAHSTSSGSTPEPFGALDRHQHHDRHKHRKYVPYI